MPKPLIKKVIESAITVWEGRQFYDQRFNVFFIDGFPVDIYPKLKLNVYSNKKNTRIPRSTAGCCYTRLLV